MEAVSCLTGTLCHGKTFCRDGGFECLSIEAIAVCHYYAAIVMVGIHHFHARNSFTLQNQAVPVRFMLHTGHLNQHLWHINL